MNKRLNLLICLLVIFVIFGIYRSFNQNDNINQDYNQYRENQKDKFINDWDFVDLETPKSSLTWDPLWEKSFSQSVVSTSISANGNLIAVAGQFNSI